MKRTIGILLFCFLSSMTLGQHYASVEFYKDNLPTISELDYLKTLLPKEKTLINEASWAVRQGQLFEYGIGIDVWFEDPDNVASVELIKPDTSSVLFVFDGTRFEMGNGYFSFDDLKADFPAGDYTINITYLDATPDDQQVFTLPDYIEGDFPEMVDGELVLVNNVWNLNWSTVAGINDYSIEADELLRGTELWEDDDIFIDVLPADTTTTFDSLLVKGKYNCEIDVEAVKFITDDDGVPIDMISCMNWWSFKKNIPVYEDKITKATVTAGINNLDTISLTGQLQAIEADFLNANDVVITLDAADMPAPIIFTFPINANTFKMGKFNTFILENGTRSTLKYDTKTHALLFSSSKIDLTGMACPITVDVVVGANFSTQIELDETIVNGTKKTCPPQLMMWVQDSLDVTKSVMKAGKKPNTDTLSVQGWFTVNGAFNHPADPFIVHLNAQTFTVPGELFTVRNGVYTCTNVVTAEGGTVSARLDTNKCLFTVSIKKASFADFGTADFDLSIFGRSLIGLEQIHMGTAYTYWQATQYNQAATTWVYNSKVGAGATEIAVIGAGPGDFQIFEDNHPRIAAFSYTEEGDNAARLSSLLLSSELYGGDMTFDVDLVTWPAFMRPGLSHTDSSAMTGQMTVSGSIVDIVNGTAAATTTVAAAVARVTVPAGTYNTVRFDETWTMNGQLEFGGLNMGTITVTFKQTNYADLTVGVVKRVRTAVITVRLLGNVTLIDRISDTYQLTAG